MIISASRRTDIPALYADWFFHRLKEGYVLSRNPMQYHQVSRLSLAPEAVDGFVFWTKNPLPMLARLDLLKPYAYYFQFTLTSYGQGMESNVPSKRDAVIPAFQRLADSIGPDRVIWRYDPVLLSAKYNEEYHQEYFYQIAKRLKGYTNKCIISFVDDYRGAGTRLKNCGLVAIGDEVQRKMAAGFAHSALTFGMVLETCAEKIDLSSIGIGCAKCVDGNLLNKLRGYPIKLEKDRNQRPHCGCDASADIGMYNTCTNGCLYCYANHAVAALSKAIMQHDTASPLLIGNIEPLDIITDRIK